MGMKVPPLRIDIMLESNPRQSIMLVWRLAVLLSLLLSLIVSLLLAIIISSSIISMCCIDYLLLLYVLYRHLSNTTERDRERDVTCA